MESSKGIRKSGHSEPRSSQKKSGSRSMHTGKGRKDLDMHCLKVLLDLKVKWELSSYLFHCIQQTLQQKLSFQIIVL